MRLYLLMAHPETASFNAALADAYAAAATARGHEVRRQNLGELDFDPILRRDPLQPLEPDLLAAQENILWCQHWVIFYPVWWGSMPALLKGYFDRLLLPEFAYRPHENDPFWEKLLGGRSAHLATTSNAPGLYLWWQYRDSDLNTVRRAMLDYCGIGPVKTTRIGSVNFLKPEKRRRWLARMADLVPR